MSTTHAKAIIVGSDELHSFFTTVYPDWDTQIPITTTDDVWLGLQNGVLSPESSVVIFTDQDVETDLTSLAVTVATFASEAAVLVLFYDMNNYEILRSAVVNKQHELNLPVASFFPISAAGNVIEDINNAILYVTGGGGDLNNVVLSSTEVVDSIQEETYFDEETQQEAVRKRGIIIASTSSKGGSGKTTVGLLTASMFYHASLAAVKQGLREEPLRVCIVDMDIRDGQINFVLSQSGPTALNIFLAVPRQDDTIADNLIYDEGLGINALLAPKRAKTADFLTPEFYMDVIDQLAYMFDVVVLDTSVNYTDALLEKVVFPISDRIIFVTSLAVGSVFGMTRWMDEITAPLDEGGAGIELNKVNVVVNQSAPNLGIDQELLEHASKGAKMLVAIPLDSAAVIAASNHNRLADIILQHTEISPAYYHIVQQLLPNEAFADPLISNRIEAPRNSLDAALNTPAKKPRKKFGFLG